VSLLSLQAVDDDGHEASRAPKTKPSITADRFNKAMSAIQDGRYTAEELRATYSLTKEQEAQL
jgi:hypothetical protein